MGRTEAKQLDIKEILDRNLRAKALGFSTLVYKLVDGDLRIEGVDWNKNSTGEYILKIMYISKEDKDRFGLCLEDLDSNDFKSNFEIHFACGTNGALDNCSLFRVIASQTISYDVFIARTLDKQSIDYKLYDSWAATRYIKLFKNITNIQVATEEDYSKLVSTIRFAGVQIELVEQGIVTKSGKLAGHEAIYRKVRSFVESIYLNIKEGSIEFNEVFEILLADCSSAIVNGKLDLEKLYEHWVEIYSKRETQ